jgi:hypothetical protein
VVLLLVVVLPALLTDVAPALVPSTVLPPEGVPLGVVLLGVVLLGVVLPGVVLPGMLAVVVRLDGDVAVPLAGCVASTGGEERGTETR